MAKLLWQSFGCNAIVGCYSCLTAARNSLASCILFITLHLHYAKKGLCAANLTACTLQKLKLACQEPLTSPSYLLELQPELRLIQLGVHAICRQQLLMTALLSNAILRYDNDHISIFNRSQPVSNYKSCSALRQLGQ